MASKVGGGQGTHPKTKLAKKKIFFFLEIEMEDCLRLGDDKKNSNPN